MKHLFKATYEADSDKGKQDVQGTFLEYEPDTAAKLLAERLVLIGLFPRRDIAIKVSWVEDGVIYTKNFLVDVEIDPFGSVRPA